MSSVYHIIDNFISEKDSQDLITFFDKNDHLCSDSEERHKHRNLHYDLIKDKKIKDLLDYYCLKNIIFIDHIFKAKTKLWNKMRLCRWKKGDSMALHIDKNIDYYYSSLLYLNDEYEGGELLFNAEVMKMKKFSCIIFESDIHVHGVKKILKHKRYTIPSWYQKINE